MMRRQRVRADSTERETKVKQEADGLEMYNSAATLAHAI